MIARLARWAVRHRVTVIACWCAAVGLSIPGAVRLQGVLAGGSDGVPGSPSVRAIERAVEAGMPAGMFFPFLVVLESDRIAVDDARFAAAAGALAAALMRPPGGGAVRSYWNTGRQDLLGRDRRSALILVQADIETLSEAELETAQVRAVVNAAALPEGFRARVTGIGPMYYDLNRQSSADLLRAERIGLPITLLILLGVFGAPLAAGLPVVLALSAMTISAATLFVLSHVVTVGVFSQNVVSMIGLGVGVDYALFVVTSFRRALARGIPAHDAAVGAVEDAGHTIVVSGVIVAIGFCALLVVNVPFLRSMALGGVAVVLTSVAASITLLPVALSYAGRAVNWPRPAADVGRASEDRWARWAALVMRRPRLFLGGSLAILAVFLVPATRLQSWNLGAEHLVPALESRQGYDVLASQFDQGLMGPTVLLIEPPPGRTVWDDEFQRPVTALAERLSRDPRVARVTGFPDLVFAVPAGLRGAVRSSADLPEPLRPLARDVVSRGDQMAMVVLLPASAPESPASIALVRDLRRDGWNEFGGLPVRVAISGTAALTDDFDDEVFRGLRLAVVLVLGATFLILLASFRSLLIPLKAIVLNLVSVGAAYGFLVYVFQDGHGAAWLGIAPPGGLNSFVVLVLFTITFGLSMDYEVFLLNVVKQEYAATGDNRRAVERAVQRTAGPITSAALIMVSIFTTFGFTELVATRELGLGLAFAVAIDATLVRLVLVPAVMALAGPWNWWLPGWRPRTSLYSSRARV